MDETTSPEAVVAGEAAAAAVDEFQTRESIAETASTAVIEASIAADASENAMESAQQAEAVAVTAADTAQTALGLVEETQNTTLSLSECLAEIQRKQQLQADEMSAMRRFLEEKLNPEQSAPPFEEVEVNDRSGNPDNERGKSDASQTGKESGTAPGATAPKRRQLRRGR